MRPDIDIPHMAPVLVGCAGWSVPSAHADAFGDGNSALQRYATQFTCAEINSSFYRSHKPGTYARWADAVPGGFRFSVKMPQAISHECGLRGAAPLLDPFLHAVHHLGERLGALLLQLPPRLVFDARVASTFFRALRHRTEIAVACEPRHESWFTAPADALLARHDIVRAAVDPAPAPPAREPGGARHLSYWRWHGGPRIYYSSYQEGDLQVLAKAAEAAARHGPAWVILDNTAQGHAVPNALRLQAMMKESRGA